MLYDRIADDANRDHTANCFNRDLEPLGYDNSPERLPSNREHSNTAHIQSYVRNHYSAIKSHSFVQFDSTESERLP